MVNCCIKGCSTRTGKEYKGEKVSMLCVPTIITNQDKRTEELTRERRALWLSRIGKTGPLVSRYYVCGKHFVSGRKAKLFDTANIDWAPTLNLGHNVSVSPDASVEQHEQQTASEVELANKVTPPKSSIVAAEFTRPNTKRKYGESSSMEPQYQAIHHQMSNGSPSYPEFVEGASTSTVTAQNKLSLGSNLIYAVREEPYSVTIVKDMPFDDKNIPFDNEIPLDHNYVDKEPFVNQVPLDNKVPFDQTSKESLETRVKEEPSEYEQYRVSVESEESLGMDDKEQFNVTVFKEEPIDIDENELFDTTVPMKQELEETSDSLLLKQLNPIVSDTSEQKPKIKVIYIQDIHKINTPTSTMETHKTNLNPEVDPKIQNFDVQQDNVESGPKKIKTKNLPIIIAKRTNSTSKIQTNLDKTPELPSSTSHEKYIPTKLNLFLRKIKPKGNDLFSSVANVEFYTHFCKYHLKIDDSEMSPTIRIPRLFRIVKPVMNPLGFFQCPKCPNKMKSANLLQQHISTFHKDVYEIFQCDVCYCKIRNMHELIDHLKLHVAFLNHFIEPGVTWKCFECESLSNRCNDEVKSIVSFQFKNIIIIKNKPLNKFNLQSANKIYFQFRLDKSLPLYEHPRKLFTCLVCSETFQTQDELDLHLESHVDCVFKKCSKCKMRCDSMVQYYDHVKLLHGGSLMVDMDFRNLIELPQKNTDENFVNICSMKIFGKFHIQLTSYPNLKCSICNVVFFDLKLFYAHCVPYTAVLPNLNCPKCEMCFSTHAESQAHLINFHNGVCNLWCAICKQPQKSSFDLDDHVLNHHNIQMVHCGLCKSNISSKQDAFAHLKSCYSKRSGNYDFICPICGFICEDLDFLLNHLRVEFHMLPPQHQCTHCLNFFYGKFNLVCHILHGKCNHCDLYFCNHKSLKDHVGIVHAS